MLLSPEAYRFIELTLFDGLLGNHDRHGRNIALIQTPYRYILSPFYDNPCYLGLEDEILLGAQHEPRGKIATSKTEEPTLKDYVFEWYRLGFENIILDFYNKIDLENIISMIDNSFVSAARKEALKKLVKNRYMEFNNAIASQ